MILRFIPLLFTLAVAHERCAIPYTGDFDNEYIVEPKIERALEELPQQLLWNDVNGTDFLTIARN